jgi:hypothetical protein
MEVFDVDKEIQKFVTAGKYKDAFLLGEKYKKKVQVLSRDGRSS